MITAQIELTMAGAAANNLGMWWRRRSIPTATLAGPHAREAVALEKLIASTDNAAVAELAKIRLRVVRFLAAREKPSADEVSAVDVAEIDPAAIELPTTRGPTLSSHLVDISAKAEALDQLSRLNLERYATAEGEPPEPVPSISLLWFLIPVLVAVTVYLCVAGPGLIIGLMKRGLSFEVVAGLAIYVGLLVPISFVALFWLSPRSRPKFPEEETRDPLAPHR